MVDLTINQIEELIQSTEGHSRMNVHRPAPNQQSHIPTHTTQLNPTTTNHPIYQIHPEAPSSIIHMLIPRYSTYHTTYYIDQHLLHPAIPLTTHNIVSILLPQRKREESRLQHTT